MPVVDCNGATLYYEDRGEGRPVVFLHGMAAGLRYFEPQLTGLADEYRTVAFDFRGQGRSETTAGGYTLAQYARDTRTVLERLDVDDAVVVGWSLGAIVSWEYVDRFGTDRVAALVDVDMEPSPLRREGYDHGTYTVAGLRETLHGLQTEPLAVLEESIDALVKEPPSRELWTTMFDEGSRMHPTVQSAMLLEVMRDYRDVLRAVDVPTLVCAGADEKWRSVASVELVADLVPDARFELFEESGHCLTLEEPERFDRVLREFVDGL